MQAGLDETYAYIDRNLDRHIARVQELIRQPSVSLTGEGVEECARLLQQQIGVLHPSFSRLERAGGHPVVFARVNSQKPDAPTLILYSLYDVMPAGEPGWVVPPFSAQILPAARIGLPAEWGDCLVGRGARNQKGPTVGFLNALEACIQTGDLPCNVLFVVEGEEELMSKNFAAFVKKCQAELSQADGAFYPNPAQDEKGMHHIYLGYRGIIVLELEVVGGDWGGPADRDLFSSDDAWIEAPAWRLVNALATMRAPDGTILVEGFTEGLRPLTDRENRMVDQVVTTFSPEAIKARLGIKAFKRGRKVNDLLRDYVTSPLLNIDGLESGYAGPNIKTCLPRSAKAKMDVRLEPNMDKDRVVARLREHLDRHGFPEVRINVLGGYNPSTTSPDRPVVRAALEASALHEVPVVCWPVYYASTPQVYFSAPPLNIPCVSAGLGRMGRFHESNEFLTLEGLRSFEKYVVTFLHQFARLQREERRNG